MTVRIRPGNPADLPAIVEMAARFYDACGYAATHGPFCADSVRATGEILFVHGVVLLAEADGGPVGLIALAVVPLMFNNARLAAHEVMWWVDPAHLATGAGLRLMREAERAAKLRGAVSIQMIHLASSPPHVGEIYRRRGYRHSESMYTKGL